MRNKWQAGNVWRSVSKRRSATARNATTGWSGRLGWSAVLVLTNSHIVSGAKTIWLSRWSGTPVIYGRVEARLAWEDPATDAAILTYSTEGGCSTAKVYDQALPLVPYAGSLGQNV